MEALYETLRSIGYTHPPHPPMTYLPLGMVIGSLLFSLISVFPRCGKFAVTARHCITLGFVGVFPTMLLGYLDWQYFYGGRLILHTRLTGVVAATEHPISWPIDCWDSVVGVRSKPLADRRRLGRPGSGSPR
jgi:uncharacterized membrane protein